MCIPRVQWIYTAFWLLIIVKDISHITFPESDFFQSVAKVVKSKMAVAAILDFGIWTLTTVILLPILYKQAMWYIKQV